MLSLRQYRAMNARTVLPAAFLVWTTVTGCGSSGDVDGPAHEGPVSTASQPPVEDSSEDWLAQEEVQIQAAGEELQQVIAGLHDVDVQLEAVVGSLCDRFDDRHYLGVAEGFYQRRRLEGTREWPKRIEDALSQQCT